MQNYPNKLLQKKYAYLNTTRIGIMYTPLSTKLRSVCNLFDIIARFCYVSQIQIDSVPLFKETQKIDITG